MRLRASGSGFARVRQLRIAHYGVEPDEITDESTLSDLGLDSLGVLAIADIVENKYGISLDDERIAGVRTVSDFKALIVLKITEVA